MISILSLITFFVFLTSGIFADPLKLDVKEYVLKNGLKLLMLEKHDVPIVCLRVNYKVGSVDERPGITGVSHLFEHMMFKGTKIFGTRDYNAEKPLLDKEDELVVKISAEKYRETPPIRKRLHHLKRNWRK